jgi:outer membrane receptor protein involved in Fe transport
MTRFAARVRLVAALGLAFGLVGALLWGAPVARAGTTGRVTGRVTDAAGKPLQGVNVAIPAARAGALTDADGHYSVMNVPAGSYDLRFQLIGYRQTTVQGVTISADQTQRQDVKLAEEAVGVAEVVVTGERPVIEVGQTSAVSTVTRKEIASLPVQELQDVVNLQAGVVDGHFRGGRIGEVQYQVDGVTVNNVYDNKSLIRIDRSLLEEVQVISGTFDAEYGQAASGVVNAVLRRGGDRFEWHGEAFLGSSVFPGRDDARLVESSIHPGQLQNYQVDVSGPLGIARSTFLASLRRAVSDDYLRGTRRFLPTDRGDFEDNVFVGTGDSASVPLGTSKEWNGVVKLSHRFDDHHELSWQVVANHLQGRKAVWQFRLDPEGRKEQTTRSIVHGFDWNHTLNKASYYSLSLRQNYTDYTDWVYEDLFDPRYFQAGPPRAGSDFENGAWVQGVDFDRFRQRTNALVVKGTYANQSNKNHLVETGGEFQWPWLRFGAPGFLLTQTSGKIPEIFGNKRYHPLIGSAYAQDEITWNEMNVRAGLRFDYFDARAGLPANLANPANSIAGAPPAGFRTATPKTSIAPRLGVSYPVSERAAIFFSYGHFYQMPPLGTVFTNADYARLTNLQAGGSNFEDVFGNPDVKPEKTVQYQFGYKHALTPKLGLDVQLFYKDVRDLLGVEFVTTYNNAEYARLTNVDFGSVTGVTIALDQRAIGLFSMNLDYTWQTARGNSSDPRETATRAEAGEDPRPRQIPFNWDQRHTLNATLRVENPGDFSVSSIVRLASGQPYTPSIASGFGGALESNSGRKPSATLVDLRIEKTLPRHKSADLRAFVRVFNLFDARYFNGFVFANSGSPFYSRFEITDEGTLRDPTRFYAPRRIELGLSLPGGGGQ